MCFDPITMTALALTLGGAGASYVGNQEAQNAQKSAVSAENLRQQAFSKQQDTALNNSLTTAANTATTGLDTATQARQAAFTAALAGKSPTQDYLPGSASADPSVAASVNKVVGDQHAFSAQQGDALARSTALGDDLLGTNINLNRNAQTIDQLGSFKVGSANVLPAELNAAAQKGAGLRGLGSLATTIGSMALMGGLAAPASGIGTAADASSAAARASAASMGAVI